MANTMGRRSFVLTAALASARGCMPHQVECAAIHQAMGKEA